jgi:hypothetical protein
MHLYEQSFINNVLVGPNCLCFGLISCHTLLMFLIINLQCGFNGWGMFVSKQFSTPHTNNGLSPLYNPNKTWTMGCKLCCVNDDQIALSNIELHNSKNSWQLSCTLTRLFPHLIAKINGFHLLLDLKCIASHNNPFTSNTKRRHSMSITNFLGDAIF